MKRISVLISLSLIVIFPSCESKWHVKDRNGSLGRTQSPVERSFRLSRENIIAAQEGRLGLLEQNSGNNENMIPLQWDLSESGSKYCAVMLMPPGATGKRNFILAESKSGFPSYMQASEDTVSGQIIISDSSHAVLRYNYKTVFEKDAVDTLPANKYIVTATDTFMANPSIYAVARSNYIHPLYGPEGELLTRDWSKDHPHHRGIYWAWPEVEYGKKKGDLHALQIVFARPTGNIKLLSGPVFAQVEAENVWMWEDREPIVREVVVIRAYRSTSGGRVIDLSFRFVALKDSITLARRETKLYGGLNIRMQTPKMQEISSHIDSASNTPRKAWSDLSGLFAGASSSSGLLILQSDKNPDYPGDYIQYPELSWIQPTFPAADTRYSLIRGKALVLRYRLMIHSGMTPDNDLSSLMWDAFNSGAAPLLTFSFPESESLSR